MALKILKHKKHRVGLIILTSVIAVILLLALFINMYWSPILAKKVKSVVLTSSDSLYTVDFSDAELHVLKGQIVLYNISLTPDTAVYNRLVKRRLAPNNLVKLHLKRLILEHVHPFKLYFQHKLDIGQIILNEPDLNVSYQLNHTKDTVVKDNRTAWQKISKSLHSIHVGMIFLNDVKLKYKDYSGNKVAISELKEMTLSASDLLIDSATQTDKSRLLYCREIIAELNNYKGRTPTGLYNYKIKHLKLSTLTSQVNIEGLSFEPVNPGTFFSKSKKDRYTFGIDSLQFNRFDYLSYHKYRTFNVSSIMVNGGSLALFNNPDKPKKPWLDKINSFPVVQLREIQTEFKIDTILVKGFDITYSEYNKKSRQTGSIHFDNTRARILNSTNNKTALQKNSLCRVQVGSYFMGRGKLNVSFGFDLAARDEAFSYKGSLGPMNLESINPATMPFALVKITSGTLKGFNFDIHANSRISKGRVTLLYNDLKIKLLAPDTNMNWLKGKMIESLFANIFIIKHNNPDKEGEAPRSFNVTFVRPKDSPFFKTMWKTLLAGIKPSVGVDDKKMQAAQTQMSQHDINKQKRKEKRAERKAKRAEKKREKELKKEQDK